MSKVYRHSDGIYRDYPESIHDMKYAPAFETLDTRKIDLNKILIESGQNYQIVLPKEQNYHNAGETQPKEPPTIKTGLKFDNDKVPLDLIPYDALVEIGKVLQAGEKKYGTANWSNGIEMRRLLAAAMRHLGQFNDGENYDEETNTLHIANAATNLMFAIWMFKNRPDLDNRWAKGVKNG